MFQNLTHLHFCKTSFWGTDSAEETASSWVVKSLLVGASSCQKACQREKMANCAFWGGLAALAAHGLLPARGSDLDLPQRLPPLPGPQGGLGEQWPKNLKWRHQGQMWSSVWVAIRLWVCLPSVLHGSPRTWVLTANCPGTIGSYCPGVLTCSSQWGLRVLKPQGQISHWLFDCAAFQKPCGMLLTSRSINLTLWDRGGIWKYLLLSCCQSGSMCTKIKSIWVHGADGALWGGSKVHSLMCLWWSVFTQRYPQSYESGSYCQNTIM